MRPTVLDPSTAERLAAGLVAPEDAPPAFADVAALLTAARAGSPWSGDRTESTTVAAMVGRIHEDLTGSTTSPPRRSPMFRKLRIASFVLAGTIVAGTGLAFAGALPAPVQSVAAHAFRPFGAVVREPASASGGGVVTDPSPSPAGDRSGAAGSNATGPDATGPAKFGLCTAFSHGQGATQGGKGDSVAFQNLQKAAADAGQSVEEFCADAKPLGKGPSNDAPTTSDGGGADQGHGTAAQGQHGPGEAQQHGGDHGSQGSGKGHRP
jgi:hypothetical protein